MNGKIRKNSQNLQSRLRVTGDPEIKIRLRLRVTGDPELDSFKEKAWKSCYFQYSVRYLIIFYVVGVYYIGFTA